MVMSSAFETIERDKPFGFYADFDNETNYYGVFGSETGFCYHLFNSELDAKIEANRMNKEHK